jgi:hypothetical protein
MSIFVLFDDSKMSEYTLYKIVKTPKVITKIDIFFDLIIETCVLF